MHRFPALLLLAASLLTAGDPWTEQDLLKPAAAAARLASGPLVIHVGFPVLYRAVHIPASVYAGPGSKAEGVEELKKAVAGVARDREIILYCGCCPWDKCPNIRPAFAALHGLGYRNVHAMVVPENMKADWVDQGYPVEKRAQ